MLKIALLSLFILNNCSKNEQCTPTKISLPKLPTYKTPKSREFKVKRIDENLSIIENNVLTELIRNNDKLRAICLKYCLINKKLNEVYSR